MPIKKPQLQIETSYFDEDTNSIFKESLNLGSPHDVGIEINRHLINSKSEPHNNQINFPLKNQISLERSPPYQYEPDSVKLLDEFRQIFYGTPQLKSQLIPFFDFSQNKLQKQDNIKDQTVQNRSRDLDKMLKAEYPNGASIKYAPSSLVGEQNGKISGLIQNQNFFSIKGASQPSSQIYSVSSLKQFQMSFAKPKQIEDQELSLQNEPKEKQNKTKIANHDANYQFGFNKPNQGFTGLDAEDKFHQLLKTPNNQTQSKQNFTRDTYEQINKNLLEQPLPHNSYYKSHSFAAINSYPYQHHYNQANLMKNYSTFQIETVRQNYNQDVKNMKQKLDFIQFPYKKLHQLELQQLQRQKVIMQQERVAILRQIWKKMIQKNFEENQNDQYNQFKPKSIGERVKPKMKAEEESDVSSRMKELQNKSAENHKNVSIQIVESIFNQIQLLRQDVQHLNLIESKANTAINQDKQNHAIFFNQTQQTEGFKQPNQKSSFFVDKQKKNEQKSIWRASQGMGTPIGKLDGTFFKISPQNYQFQQRNSQQDHFRTGSDYSFKNPSLLSFPAVKTNDNLRPTITEINQTRSLLNPMNSTTVLPNNNLSQINEKDIKKDGKKINKQQSFVSTSSSSANQNQYYPYSRKSILKYLQRYEQQLNSRHTKTNQEKFSIGLFNCCKVQQPVDEYEQRQF